MRKLMNQRVVKLMRIPGGDEIALALFRRGSDTLEIARELNLWEALVCRMIHRAREREKALTQPEDIA